MANRDVLSLVQGVVYMLRNALRRGEGSTKRDGAWQRGGVGAVNRYAKFDCQKKIVILLFALNNIAELVPDFLCLF